MKTEINRKLSQSFWTGCETEINRKLSVISEAPTRERNMHLQNTFLQYKNPTCLNSHPSKNIKRTGKSRMWGTERPYTCNRFVHHALSLWWNPGLCCSCCTWSRPCGKPIGEEIQNLYLPCSDLVHGYLQPTLSIQVTLPILAGQPLSVPDFVVTLNVLHNWWGGVVKTQHCVNWLWWLFMQIMSVAKTWEGVMLL